MNADKRRWFLRVFVLCLAPLVIHALPEQEKRRIPEKPLDLNTATIEELQELPEVGQKLAEAIVRFRLKSGPFRRVEELLAVPGITRRRLEKIRPLVFVKAHEEQKEKPQAKPTGSDARPASGLG